MADTSETDIQDELDRVKGQVTGHPSGHTYELRLRLREPDGTPAYGTIVYYVAPAGTVKTAEYNEGDYASLTVSGGPEGPMGGIVVGLFGRVADSFVFSGDLTEPEGNAFAVKREIEATRPGLFGGVQRAAFVDDRFFVTWTRPRIAAVNGYEVSIALKKRADELFLQKHSGKNPFGFDVYTDMYLKSWFRPGYDQGVFQRAQFPDWGWALGKLDYVDYTGSPRSVTVYTEESWDDKRQSHVSFPYPLSWKDPDDSWDGFDEDQVAAAHAEGLETNIDYHVDVEQPEDESTWGTNVPDSISIDQAGGEVVRNDAFILEAVAAGTDPDPTVVWESTGPQIIRAGPRRCVVVASQPGDVTAISSADSAVTDTISYTVVDELPRSQDPSPPASVNTQSVAPPVTARISWPLPDVKDVGRRVYLSEDPDTVMENPVGTSFGKSLRVRGLDTDITYHGAVAAVSSDGVVSDGTTTFTLDPKDPSQFPAVMRETPPPEVRLAPGGSYSMDLSNHAHLDGGASWSTVEFEIIPLVEDTEISVTRPSDSVLEFSATSNAVVQSNSYVPVLVELTRGSRQPVWFGTLVSIRNTTGTGAPQICGLYSKDLEGASLDGSALVGEGAETHFEGRWGAKLGQVGGQLGETDLSPSHSEPQIIVFAGAEGASMVLSSPAPNAPATVPQLPGSVAKIERQGEYVAYTDGLLDGRGEHSAPWRRAIDGTDLYDLSLTKPPTPVYYAAPQVFDGTWLNEDQYPGDAELADGFAVYRAGLESPPTQQVTPTVEAFTATPEPGKTTLSWRIVLQGEEFTRPAELSYWKKSAPAQKTTVTGEPGLELNLRPQETYQAELYGTTIEFTTRPTPPDITAHGQALGSGGYEYTYELEENGLDSWTDPFGTGHTSDEVTIQAGDPIEEHRLVLTWPTDQQQATIPTSWRLPNEKVGVEAEVETGLLIPTNEIARPTFTREQYAGTREVVLQNDIYAPGTWNLSPAGYLPQPLNGTIGDYVEVAFVRPGGEETGRSIELSRPTKLSIKLSIRAEDGISPVVYGVVRWKK